MPPPATIEYPSLLRFATPHVKAYSRYTVVAEKLQAAVELGLANSRLKDFFDLFTLASQFEFDGPQLVSASAIVLEPLEAARERTTFRRTWHPGGRWVEVS